MKWPTSGDLLTLLTFLILIPFGRLLRRWHPDIWLISERPGEARDNAYWFFRYCHDQRLHPRAYYVIRRDAHDAERIRSIAADKLIPFGSLRHYIYYIAATVHVSSHVGGGMTNARVARFLEVRGLLKNSKVYVKHGIEKDTRDWLFQKHSRIDLFCCAAQREMDHILNIYGYSESQVALTGLCRYDQLNGDASPRNSRTILVFPTWRKYLRGMDEREFVGSAYYVAYSSLLGSPALREIIDHHDVNVVFHLHPEMQKFSHLFRSTNPRIKISESMNDIQTLLVNSDLLVTDYSSVSFDVAYMKKPILHYQFDYADFREGHWATGYFDFEDDGFGPILDTEAALLDAIAAAIDSGFTSVPEYELRVDTFFAHHDASNCARTFEAIQSLGDRT